LIFGHGLGNILRKNIEQNLLPTLRMCNRRNRINRRRQRDACAGLG
jgi:hypothetical protein